MSIRRPERLPAAGNIGLSRTSRDLFAEGLTALRVPAVVSHMRHFKTRTVRGYLCWQMRAQNAQLKFVLGSRLRLFKLARIQSQPSSGSRFLYLDLLFRMAAQVPARAQPLVAE